MLMILLKTQVVCFFSKTVLVKNIQLPVILAEDWIGLTIYVSGVIVLVVILLPDCQFGVS
jgi:hypothetical protein